ncbi:hypothetical protein LEP1GSC036_0331 [Leptospira weilii str. 2006001853]|uniref:Uncharacterized protein n=1 Tax=Leptospira weilii str. 2006001853 TaxID=1001589 RepID=A0A828Z2E3_9LEPT|nr:hypothetical protein LEP1GSC036_0331 [Leptospira weilii str. 2006001853]
MKKRNRFQKESDRFFTERFSTLDFFFSFIFASPNHSIFKIPHWKKSHSIQILKTELLLKFVPLSLARKIDLETSQ